MLRRSTQAIEAIADDEATLEDWSTTHLASCPDGARSMARQLERLLAERPVPSAPPEFTAQVFGRTWRERWRNEQVVDLVFNIALVAIVLTVIGAEWCLMRRNGLTVVGSDVVNLFETGFSALASRIAASPPLYAAATAILTAVLGLWWWVDWDASLWSRRATRRESD